MKLPSIFVVLPLVGWFAGGSANAGPISWSYSSQGGEKDGLSMTGDPLSRREGSTSFDPWGSFGPSEYHSPGLYGPITLGLTITDDASSESTNLDLTYWFRATEPDNWVSPILTGFEKQQFTLGDNSYSIEAVDPFGLGGGVFVTVTGGVAATPEPATIVLASLGAGGAWLVRRRRGSSRATAAGQIGLAVECGSR